MHLAQAPAKVVCAMPPIINQHFWLATGIWCGLCGCAYMKFKLRKHVAAGEFTSDEANSFTRNFALWVLLPSCALWALQQSIGAEATPICLVWPAPQRVAAIGLQLLLWGAMLHWVFRRDGASTLARFTQALRSPKPPMFTPAVFKMLAIAAIVSGLVALIIGPQMLAR